MLSGREIKAAGDWSGQPADTIVLDYDDRHRRRMTMTGVRGLAFLLDLPTPVALRSGDAVVLEDGRLVEVLAAPEALLEIRTRDTRALARVAWHLGNRHLPVQFVGEKLRIRADHVIAAMLDGLGAGVRAIEAPFDPEGGAYAEGASHRHGHAHHHHGHDHKHD